VAAAISCWFERLVCLAFKLHESHLQYAFPRLTLELFLSLGVGVRMKFMNFMIIVAVDGRTALAIMVEPDQWSRVCSAGP